MVKKKFFLKNKDVKPLFIVQKIYYYLFINILNYFLLNFDFFNFLTILISHQVYYLGI